MSAPEQPEPGPATCPRCGAPIGPDQDWCLECGAPARTRLAPTPNWHIPAAILAVIVAVAGAALAVAFVRLTEDAPPVATTTAGPAPAEGVTPPPQTAPPVTSSIATTPAATTPPTETGPPPTTLPGQTQTQTQTQPGAATQTTTTETTQTTPTTGTSTAGVE